MTENKQVPKQEDDDQITASLGETLPDYINDVDLGSEEQRGILSPLLDPIGQGLQTVLTPVGNLIGGIGDRMAVFTEQEQGQPKDKGGQYEKFGGKEQNGGNPLGL